MKRATITRLACGFLLLAWTSRYDAASSSRPNHELPAKQSDAGTTGQKQDGSSRTRIAEGEYELYRQASETGVGPFDPAVYNFNESWVLWRLPDGSLEAEGERHYDSPQDQPHIEAFSVKLSSEFRVT